MPAAIVDGATIVILCNRSWPIAKGGNYSFWIDNFIRGGPERDGKSEKRELFAGTMIHLPTYKTRTHVHSHMLRHRAARANSSQDSSRVLHKFKQETDRPAE